MSISDRIFNTFCHFLTRVSPTINNQFISIVTRRELLNLRNPKTFHEKLVWLKLNRYNNDLLVKKCADKYTVREYIEENGLGQILVPLIDVYDRIEDISWDNLPHQFAMKFNYGSGYNIICTDKDKLDIPLSIEKMQKWSKEKIYLDKAELQYKDVKLKLLVEQYLRPEHGALPADYKVYCFNGEPKAIFFMVDRGEHTKAMFFDTEWEFLSEPISGRYPLHNFLPPKPACLEELLHDARILAKPFPFVRVDFYCLNDKIYFGEMTFTPAGGIFASECFVHGKSMGELLDIDH